MPKKFHLTFVIMWFEKLEKYYNAKSDNNIMEHCSGCDQFVEDPIRLDDHCKLPYCKKCVTNLAKDYENGKIYSQKFKNPDARECERCHEIFEIGYIVRHAGKYEYDCTFCESCIGRFGRWIHNLKNK